jgi:6-phosphofructokinase 1
MEDDLDWEGDILRRIGVITAGGDAPGMNAAIRAVVRTAIYHGLEVIGIERGYAGLIEGQMRPMDVRSVSGIINKGGTILKTARCPEFETYEGRRKAVRNLERAGVEGLVIIGGDGSLHGLQLLDEEWGVPAIGVPATIDNDVPGTDYSIGFDTAVNTALEAIDRIRDTAESHERIFVIEVMGRSKGFIALEVAVGGGAEIVLLPEIPFDMGKVCEKLEEGRRRGKRSSIVVTAEGAARAEEVGMEIERNTGLPVRTAVLGHIQRGGTPTAFSRSLACRLGAAAVELLIRGEKGKMVGVVGGVIKASEVREVLREEKRIDTELYRVFEMLAI